MSFYQSNEEDFVKKCRSILADAIYNDKITLLRFLTIREQEILKYVVGKEAYIYSSKISDEDEYKRIIVSPFELEPDFKISIFKLEYNKRYLNINHRMVLGTLMSLGVTRDSIGDIYITEMDDVYLCVTKEISNYIINEFKTLSHQSISLKEVCQIDGKIKQNLEVKNDFLASLRLDIVIASMYNLSRKESLEIIKEGRVKVNQKPTMNNSQEIKENDVISVKGFGKMKLLEVGGLSKRDRIFVKLGKYL